MYIISAVNLGMKIEVKHNIYMCPKCAYYLVCWTHPQFTIWFSLFFRHYVENIELY